MVIIIKTKQLIKTLNQLCYEINIEAMVLHPDTVENFDILDKSGLPFLIENMDTRKKSGTTIQEFIEFKQKFSFGFVLDLEDAYEHDNSMKIAHNFVEVMGDRLKRMHVSGCSDTKLHVPLGLREVGFLRVERSDLQKFNLREDCKSEPFKPC